MNNVKKSIGWADFTINPIKGLCPVACKDNQGKEYCYAAGERGLYKRFKWNPEIRFEPEVFADLIKVPAGSKVFIGSTMELFWDGHPKKWLDLIFYNVKLFPDITFQFLTKQPQNLPAWSPFPDNCWVGVSVTTSGDMTNAFYGLSGIKAGKTFISFEPLLGAIGINDHVPLKNAWLDWVIIGQKTPPNQKTTPKIEWIKEIVESCDKANIPVFLKNNLMNMFVYNQQSIMLPHWALNRNGEGGLRQEFPCLNHR